MESSNLLSGNLVNKLRLTILICLALWLSMILLDSLLLDNQNRFSSSNQYLPFINETVSNKNNTEKIFFYQIGQYVQIQPERIPIEYQIVLFWTKYFGEDILSQIKRSMDGNTNNFLIRPKLCYEKYPNCLVTSDRAFVKEAKSIIFHWRDYNQYDTPKIRFPHQLWVLYNLEAPPNAYRLPKHSDNFNLTATYRQDSDIYIPYGHIVKRPSPINLDLEHTIDLKFKIKPVVWFVSHCDTQSHREVYVKNLSKMIQVDIYGKCGKLRCPRSDECYVKAAKEYLFYLSFENSLCKDYVTEKLFNVLNFNIVPIVYGGANYSSILPPGSYINASQMSPRTLAKLIIKIASNRKLYLSYFEWRKTHLVSIQSNYESELFCKLCERLHRQNSGHFVEEQSKTWNEINQWFFNNSSCHNPVI